MKQRWWDDDDASSYQKVSTLKGVSTFWSDGIYTYIYSLYTWEEWKEENEEDLIENKRIDTETKVDEDSIGILLGYFFLFNFILHFVLYLCILSFFSALFGGGIFDSLFFPFSTEISIDRFF